MEHIANAIFDALLKVFKHEEIVVALISIIPIVEARLAVPIAIRYGISPVNGWLLAFAGSSLIVPLLLLILIPFIRWLAKTKLFRKVGETIYEKFEKKSQGLNDAPQEGQRKSDLKKMLGVFLFVAVPLPLTGVWTGSAVASIIKLKYPKAVAAVIAGNLVASGIITLLCVFFEKYIDYIILALTLIAVIVVIVLIIKIIIHKPASENRPDDGESKE